MKSTIKKEKRAGFISLIFILLFFISFAITSYFAWESHVKFKETLVNQWNQQLESTLEISSINLTNYFTKFSQNLEYLTHDTVIQRWAYTGQMSNCNKVDCPLGNLYNLHKNETDALLLIDSTGIVIEHYPEPANRICDHCKSMPSLDKSKVDRNVQISEVFINKTGDPAITISYPLYYKKRFAGGIRWMVKTSNISRQFIAPVKVGIDGYMFVLDKNENVISHPNYKLIGKSVSNILDSISKIDDKKHNTEHVDETKLFFQNINQSFSEGSGKYIDFFYDKYSIAAYKKIDIGNNKWILIVSMPYSEISSPVRKNALTTFALAGAILLIIFIIGIAFFKVQKKKAKLEVETKYLSELAKTAEELKTERSMRLTAMIDGQENERQRISREIHDGLGQYLLAMKVKLENEINNRKNQNPESLTELKSLFLNTIEEVKRISDNLIPVILEEFGISTALKNLCDEFSKDNNIKIEFVSFGVPADIDYKTQTYIYRMAQEGLSNIIKHSNSKEANVQLLGNSDQVNLIIQDEGSGFSVKETIKGNGLNNMKERAAILNGSVEIISNPGEGTTIAIKIPLK